MTASADLSSRTLTFLYTDLEGSTVLWEHFPGAIETALSQLDRILREAIETNGGQVFRTVGDGLCAVFANAFRGLAAALDAQRKLQTAVWEETGTLRVRMVLQTGEAEARNGDYFGSSLNRIGRLLAITHGGQTLLSQTTQLLVRGSLPAGADLLDLGEIRLRDLSYPEHVYQLLHPDLLTTFPPLASLDRQANNLPIQPTTLIGREAELAEVTRRLETDPVRLLTLTGPGGTGKTRLALQAAAELTGHFPDGVYFVDLAQINEPENVLPVLARTLSLRETTDRPLLDELVERLHARQMLLLLDNFEQVTAAAPVVIELLSGCPLLKLLVTSREALHVRGEYIFPVPPLTLPEADFKQVPMDQLTQYEAVRLFIERAQAVKPGFTVTNENAPAVAEICVRLDGLPLAIELAASRIGLFSPQALLDRLGSRLKLLRGGARDLPVRQQTLRDTIDWSYQLLDAEEQALFSLFSVFSGCSYEAVEGVVGRIERLEEDGVDTLDGLTSLVEKSLIRQVDQADGETRLMMFETIREYAVQRLAESPEFHAAVCQAHAAFFAEFTHNQWDRLSGDSREAALAEMVNEIENIRTAWRFWVGKEDLEQLGKFIDSLWLLYDAQGWYHATVDLSADLLHILSSTPSTPERAQEESILQTSLARALMAVNGYTPQVEQAYTRALELSRLAGDNPQMFPVLRGLSTFYMFRGEFEKVIGLGEQMLSLAEQYDDAGMRVEGHLMLGVSISMIEDLGRGLDHLEKGIADFDPSQMQVRRFRLGNNPGVVCCTTSSLVLWMMGFPDRALQRSNEAIDLANHLNHPYSLAYAWFHRSLLHLWRREAGLTQECAQSAIQLAEEHDFQVWKAVGMCLSGAGQAEMGRAEEGLTLIGRGMAIYQGLKTPPVFWPMLLSIQAAAYAQGNRTEEALSLLEKAIQIPNMGYIGSVSGEFYRLKGVLLQALEPDHPAKAEPWLQQALDVAQRIHSPMLELRAAVSLSRLWLKQGKGQPGRQLLSKAYEKIPEGFMLADLIEARTLIQELA